MVDLLNLPCELGNPGELPNPTNAIDGGTVEGPGDDGIIIVIQHIPPADRIPPRGGGQGGGGGPLDFGPPTSGVPPGTSTGGGGGGGGGSSISGWICIPGTGTTPGHCVFVTDPPVGPFVFSTQNECELFCVDNSTSGDPSGVWLCQAITGVDGAQFRCVFTSNPPAGATTYPTRAACEAECVNSVPPSSIGGGNFIPIEEVEGFQFENLSENEINTFVDGTYYPTIGESQEVNLTEGHSYSELFNVLRDQNLNNIIDTNIKTISDINDSFRAISPKILKASLVGAVKDILFNLVTPDGRPIPEYKITKGLLSHIANGTLGNIDVNYILTLYNRSVTTSITRSSIELINKSQFGISRKALNAGRKSSANTVQNTLSNITPNTTRGVLRALSSAKHLDPNKYTDLTKELVKLWYIVPEDINRRLDVTTSSGDIDPLYISNSDTITIVTSSYTTTSIPVIPYTYRVSGITSALESEDFESTSDIDRAFAIPSVVEQASLYDVGSEFKTFFSVSSPEGLNLEFNYDLSSARVPYFIFKLETSTIEDVDEVESIFIKKTSAKYTRITDITEINEILEFQIYPWKAFFIDHNDPILGHISTSSTYNFTFTNLSLHQFGINNGEKLFVRRIPKLITIIPTDRYQYTFFNGNSKLTSWNSREISFEPLPDPSFSNTGLDRHWIDIRETYPATDIFGEINLFGRKGQFTRSGMLQSGFTGTEPLPRRRHGLRAIYEIVNELASNYILEDGLLWSDVFLRMTLEEYNSYKIGIPNEFIEKMRKGDLTNVKLYHNSVGSFNRSTRLTTLRHNGADTLPIKLIKLETINENN